MIEDRVLKLEAQMRSFRDKIDAVWVDFKTWKSAHEKKVSAREQERCAKIADGAKETDHPQELEQWNEACTFVADQIRRKT